MACSTISPRGKAVDDLQGITAQAGSASLLSFQWDQPWFSVNGKGSASDLDIYFVDDTAIRSRCATTIPTRWCASSPVSIGTKVGMPWKCRR